MLRVKIVSIVVPLNDFEDIYQAFAFIYNIKDAILEEVCGFKPQDIETLLNRALNCIASNLLFLSVLLVGYGS